MADILIVEDEKAISEFIKLNLSVVGYNTYEVFDGEEAVNILKAKHIDLVLLDIMLPKSDGYEVLPVIIEKNIPVILVTARDRLEDRVKGLNLGADDYITKPFEGIELLARVNAVLRRVGSRQLKKALMTLKSL